MNAAEEATIWEITSNTSIAIGIGTEKRDIILDIHRRLAYPFPNPRYLISSMRIMISYKSLLR